jgi:hypothetical protein
MRVMAFWLLPVTTLIRSASPDNWYEVDTDRMALGSELSPALRHDDLVAFLGQQSSDLMFCTGSRGWADSARPWPFAIVSRQRCARAPRSSFRQLRP